MKEHILRVDQPGGMDERHRATPPAANEIVDMRWDPLGAWRSVGGYSLVHPGLDVAGVIRSLWWWSAHNGARRFLVYEHEDAAGAVTLRSVDWAGSGSNTIQSGRARIQGPNVGTWYSAQANWLYILNGEDAPVRWDGLGEVVRVGFESPPPAPRVVGPGVHSVSSTSGGFHRQDEAFANYVAGFHLHDFQHGVGPQPDLTLAGSGNQPWTYGYAVSWVNDRGNESPLSEIIYVKGHVYNPGALETFWPSIRIYIDRAPKHVYGMRLYRTRQMYDLEPLTQGVQVYLHTEFATGGYSVLNDGKADRDLGPVFNPDSVGVTPRGARFFALFKGVSFVGPLPENPGRIQYSAPVFIEQFPEANWLPIGDQDSGHITGMYPTKNALVVFKQRGIYLIKGDPVNGFHSETLTEDVGSAGPVKEVPGVGLCFLADSGPYLLLGALENTGTPTQVVYIGGPIGDTWRRRVSVPSLASARMATVNANRELWIQVPADGSARQTLGLVYHWELTAWSIRDNWPIAAMATSRDAYGRLYLGSWDSAGHPGIFIAGPGFSTKGGDALAPSYTTAWLDTDRRLLPAAVSPYVRGLGVDLSVQLRTERRPELITVHDTSRTSHDTERNEERWGTALWGADLSWEGYTLTRVRYSVSAPQSFEVQFKFSSSSALELVGYYLHTDRPSGSISKLEQ